MLSLNWPEKGVPSEFNADDIVLMSKTIKGHKNKFLNRKEAFESKGLRVNLGKTKVMDKGSIAYGLYKCKIKYVRFAALTKV